MTKKLISAALLVLMILSLTLSAAGCSKGEDTPSEDAAARIAQLEQENASLRAELEELNSQMGLMKQKTILQDWALNADAWVDSNGATVTFTATPKNYVDGQKAALSVRMGDLEAESTNCVWDGAAFTGSVELSAVDGYSYYCILTSPDGSQEEIELNSPENVTNETLVYLGTSLTAYANLVVEDWNVSNSSLNVTSGYVQVQMPLLAAGGVTPSLSKGELVLKLNNEEIARQAVNLTEGEGSRSFEAVISGTSFSIPALEEDYQLDLWLEASLNTGNVISVSGGSWFNNNGELQLVVG